MQGMDRLLTLQKIDTSVERLTARRSALEAGATVAAARAEADLAEQTLGELRLQIDAMGVDQRRFEHEIDSISQKETAEHKRMYDGSIVNAKELEALQHEIENLKKRRVDREDELLNLLELREEVDARALTADTLASDLRTKLDTTVAEAADELVGVTEELDGLNIQRAELVPQFDPDLLELYEDLRRLKKGIGAAGLVDGVCQACHEQLSAMQLDKLKRAEGIRRCEHCRRILVF
jgi:predicted  nucleic acid-binding Zn-ribbon protein